jgi:integrase
MTSLPALAIEATALALPAADLEAAASFARQEKAPATRAAYRSDFAAFRVWCLAKGVDALPAAPASVAAYLAHEAERGSAPSTITRRCAAIRYAHRLADLEPPTASEHVRATLRGIRRAVGAAPTRKAPVLAEQARAMADAAPASLKGVRDRALLLLGFAGAFRRSELVALDVADLQETDDGIRVLIRRSKTDQEGHGETIAIVRGHHACPVKAVKAWLSAAGITEGPLLPRGEGRPTLEPAPHRQERVRHRESLCGPAWAQGRRVRRPFAPGRIPHERRSPGRVGVQDARCVTPQIDGRVAGLCPRC